MCTLQKAAPWVVLLFIFLWPQIVRCLILPENIRRDDASQARLLPGRDRYLDVARVPEIIAYNQDATAITFKISCIDCTEEEKRGFVEEAISIEVFPNGIQSCGYTDDVGLRINGQRLVPNTGLAENRQSYDGSLSTNNGRSSIFDKIRWTNICGCLNALPGEDCGDSLESVLIFEVPGVRGTTPGFTLSYKQHGGGGFLRITNFPDWMSMDNSMFGRSPHWRTPLLQLQMGSLPASTLLSTFSSVFPSMTTPAASVTHTARSVGHVSTSTEVPAPSTTPALPAPTPALLQPALPPPVPVLNVQGPGSGHDDVNVAEGISAFEHSLTAIWHKAQSAAQSAVTSLHSLHMCSKDGVSQSIKALKQPAAFVPATPSNTARAKIPTASGSAELSDTFSFVSDSRDFHVTSRQTIALQITILVMIILALVTSIFILIRRNPRLRAEMAAQREERRNKRLFRRAACNYRWRKALDRFRALRLRGGGNDLEKDSNDDLLSMNDPIDHLQRDEWPEKRNSTEAVVVTNIAGIREGLRELRKAHQLVDNMMTAEEGRFDRMGRIARHHRSWSDSANSDKTAPPPYEEEEEVRVADGMRYVRRVPDTTPDSSVIATSPHSSVVDSDSESEKE